MSRTRTRSTITPLEFWEYKNYPYNHYTGIWGTPTVLKSGNQSCSNLQESITDVIIPSYESRSAKGEIFNNPLTQSKILEEKSIGNYHRQQTVSKTGTLTTISLQDGTINLAQALQNEGLGAYLSYYPVITPSASVLSERSAQAVTKSFANRTPADVLSIVTALELIKSVTTVTGILKTVKKNAHRLRKNLTKVRRNKYSPYNIKPDDYKTKFVDSLKDLSSKSFRELRTYEELWMEARYNLRPLYYDIMGTSKALSQPLKENSRQTSRGFTTYTDEVISEYTQHVGGTYTSYDVNIRRRSALNVAFRAGVLSQIESETRAAKLGLYEIPRSIWDLVPASFIFDWFYDIGSLISAWTPRMGSKTLASWVVQTIEQIQSVEMDISNVQGGSVNGYLYEFDLSYTGLRNTRITTVKTRTPNPTREIFPTLDVRIDPAKLIDLGIILKQFALDKAALKKYRL